MMVIFFTLSCNKEVCLLAQALNNIGNLSDGVYPSFGPKGIRQTLEARFILQLKQAVFGKYNANFGVVLKDKQHFKKATQIATSPASKIAAYTICMAAKDRPRDMQNA